MDVKIAVLLAGTLRDLDFDSFGSSTLVIDNGVTTGPAFAFLYTSRAVCEAAEVEFQLS